jgi:hypothetical protein
MTKTPVTEVWTDDALIKAANTIFAGIKGQQAYLKYLKDSGCDENLQAEMHDDIKMMRAVDHYEKMVVDADPYVIAKILLRAIERYGQSSSHWDEVAKLYIELDARVAAYNKENA